MSILELKQVTHQYGKGTSLSHVAVENISFAVERGELIGIIGHTGSGKSTLIQHCNGLLKPDSGEILLNGKNIWENKQATRDARFRVGLCFQYPEYQLFEETVYKDIAFGPKNMKLDEAEVDLRVHRAADFVGLDGSLLQKSPFDLSGGEKRRAAIAGVMAMEPEVLILDEPTAGLDPRGRKKIIQMVESYRTSTGKTVLFVSHSMEDIAAIADRVLVLSHSHVAMFDTVERVFSRTKELREMGLDIPQITAIMLQLREQGIPVSANVFSLEQAIAALEQCRKGGGA